LIFLTNIIFSYVIFEKRLLGIGSVIIITLVSLRIINVYIRLVFRLRLEFVSFKIRIYFLIIIFFFLRVLSRLNFKFKLVLTLSKKKIIIKK